MDRPRIVERSDRSRQGDRECVAGRSDLAERTLQQIGHAQDRRIPLEIFAIQPFALDADNPEDVAPLAIGHFPVLAIRAKFLQKNVFGGWTCSV
jgi:hypothetical protein